MARFILIIYFLFAFMPQALAQSAPNGFHWGTSVRPLRNAATVSEAKSLGVNSARFEAWWKEIEPVLVHPKVTVNQVDAKMIQDYMANPSIDWGWVDQTIDAFEKAGIRVFLGVASAYQENLPQVDDGNGNIVPLNPDTYGREEYLGAMYLHVSAVAQRYKHRVEYYQLENELNAAGPTTIWGWRDGWSWWDPGFLTDVLATLNKAVKGNDPTSKVAVNFHTMSPGWMRMVRKWKKYLDVIGVDIYPNYWHGWPVGSKLVGTMVKLAKRVAPNMPVMILETGFPSGPWFLGLNEKRQAKYLEEASASAIANGADGFYWFKLKTPDKLGGTGTHFPFTSYILQFGGLKRPGNGVKPAWHRYRKVMGYP